MMPHAPHEPAVRLHAVPAATLLSVRDLVTTFRAHDATVRAVDGVSFDVPEGATRPVLLSARYTPSARGAGENGAFSVSFQVNEQGCSGQHSCREFDRSFEC